MKAMILAAGLGTRLRPLTDDRPKALVTVNGRTLLEICVERLRGQGITEIIVNTHHFSDMVAGYLAEKRNFGMRIEISREEELLDTGGGLKQAAWFFLEGDRDEPFLVHNVDVISTIDLAAMLAQHRQRRALASLAVQSRASTRALLFDEHGQLCGRSAGPEGRPELIRAVENPLQRAFCGIHVVSPRLLDQLEEQCGFPIVPAYLRLAKSGAKIEAFDADAWRWRDLGRLESLAAAAQETWGGAA